MSKNPIKKYVQENTSAEQSSGDSNLQQNKASNKLTVNIKKIVTDKKTIEYKIPQTPSPEDRSGDIKKWQLYLKIAINLLLATLIFLLLILGVPRLLKFFIPFVIGWIIAMIHW